MGYQNPANRDLEDQRHEVAHIQNLKKNTIKKVHACLLYYMGRLIIYMCYMPSVLMSSSIFWTCVLVSHCTSDFTDRLNIVSRFLTFFRIRVRVLLSSLDGDLAHSLITGPVVIKIPPRPGRDLGCGLRSKRYGNVRGAKAVKSRLWPQGRLRVNADTLHTGANTVTSKRAERSFCIS